MATIREALRLGLAGTVLAAALVASGAEAPAQNSDLEQMILKSLTPVPKPTAPRPVTRSLTSTPLAEASAPNEDRQFLDSVKNKPSRVLTSAEREHIATLAKERPSVDIEINFPSGSTTVGPAAVPSVTALGKALSNPELKGGTFVVAGHTDAKGSYPFNQDLSEKRAESVKRYLVDHFQIPASTLVAVGYGKTKLKSESDPNGAENRRVQVVNMEERAVSER